MEQGDRPTKRRRRESSNGSLPHTCRELGLMRRRSEHGTVSFVGSASGIHFVQSVYNAVPDEAPDRSGSNQSPEQDAVPGEDDQLPPNGNGRISKGFWQPGEVSTFSNAHAHSSDFSFEELLAWSQSFWDNWHPAYPFLHAPTVLEWFRIISEKGLGGMEIHLSPLKLAIVRSIMSISLADRRQTGEVRTMGKVPAALILGSFSKAMESVQSTLVHPPDLEALQALVSVELFLVSMLRHNAASRLGGLILRMAYQMGLHRCPARYPTFSREERELRQRLFWTIYCLDRHICQSLGSPLTLRDDDIDVCYFDKEVHISDSSESMDDRLAFMNFLAKHGEIKGLILELCHKSINHRKEEHDQANLIHGKITKWMNDIETFLDDYPPESQPITSYHRKILDLLGHESIIALERPLLTSPEDPRYNNALQSCISASRSIINSLDGAELPLLWPSMTWAVWMSAFVMLFAAIKNEVPTTTSVRYANQSIDILKRVSSRGSVWPSACAAAVGDLCSRLSQEQKTGRSNRQRQGHSLGTQPSDLAALDVQKQSISSDSLMPDQFSTPATGVGSDTAQGEVRYMHNLDGMDGGNSVGVGTEPSGPADTLFDMQSIDLFDGFDIPFYMGDDQFAAWMP